MTDAVTQAREWLAALKADRANDEAERANRAYGAATAAAGMKPAGPTSRATVVRGN